MTRNFSARNRMPAEWESHSEDWDYIPLLLPPDVTRVTASMRLAVAAEFGDWELSRVRLYSDGSRKLLLKRKKIAHIGPTAGFTSGQETGG